MLQRAWTPLTNFSQSENRIALSAKLKCKIQFSCKKELYKVYLKRNNVKLELNFLLDLFTGNAGTGYPLKGGMCHID